MLCRAMDPITLSYYAVVCGLLASFVPPGLRLPLRFAIGVGVGLLAAGVLPLLRGALGA